MRNIEAQMEAVKQKAERQRVIMLAVGIVALIVFVSTFIVVRKNKNCLQPTGRFMTKTLR